MRIEVPHQGLSVDIEQGEWEVDAAPDEVIALHGIYLRSSTFGFYMNVRRESSVARTLDDVGMIALLREQTWGGAPFEEWSACTDDIVVAGGCFEAPTMPDEFVVESFLTDGKSVANIVGPVQRVGLSESLAIVKRLAATLRFA